MALIFVAHTHGLLLTPGPRASRPARLLPRAALVSRNHMVLGSFLGGHELRISTSENTALKPLSISICQSIYGPGEWLKS